MSATVRADERRFIDHWNDSDDIHLEGYYKSAQANAVLR